MVSHHRISAVVTACTVAALTISVGCGRRAPDASGDTSLAHDLAEVQMAGTAVDMARRDSGADTAGIAGDATPGGALRNAASAAIDTAFGRFSDSARKTAPAATGAAMSAAPAPTPRVATATGEPCASALYSSQVACFTRGLHSADARIRSLYQSIVSAVRRQQHVSARSANPPYVAQLDRAQRKWTAWRDGECRRRTMGSGGRRWAVPRVSCVNQLTDARAAELRKVLAQLQGGG